MRKVVKVVMGLTAAALLVAGSPGTALAGPPPQPTAGAPAAQCADMGMREHVPLGVNHACVAFPAPGRSGQAPGHQP